MSLVCVKSTDLSIVKMEATALSLAGNALGVLMPMLQEKLLRILNVRDNARFIKDELESMNAFLIMNATTMRTGDLEFEAWVRQVRHLANDIEDWAEEFTWRLSQPHWRGINSCLLDVVRFIKDLAARVKIANNVHELKSRVLEVGERSKRYGLPGRTTQEPTSSSIIVPTVHMQHDPRLAAHLIDDSQLVGIDEPRDTLMNWLVADNEFKLSVISVVGMGGLGKTTLVKKLFESKMLGERFRHRAWITVSQSFDLVVLLKDMIRQLSGVQVLDDETEEQLAQLLHREIMKLSERYVIVFDDVWSLNAWERISPALPDNHVGSRIIVTTRNVEIASFCSQNFGHVYQLNPLSTEDSWLLFCKKVFPHLNGICPPNFTGLAQKILSKCEGLPLAIVTIGGVLASKPLSELEWQRLHDHLGSLMESHPSLDRMTQILAYSYNDLPYFLKPFFLYLSIFPEDYQIRRKRLLRRWMAEGLVCGTRDMSVQNVAESYFAELMKRSMILQSLIYANGTIHMCRVHDVMLEFIITMSMKENLSSIINEGQQPQEYMQKARHLSMRRNTFLTNTHNKSLNHVRSITVFSEERVSLKNTRGMKLLRVLDLEGCEFSEDEDLEIIGEFSLLKYLNLRNTSIQSLPKSIAKLQNLETLDLKWSRVRELPHQILNLHKLQYLSVGGFERAPPGPALQCHGAEMPNGIQALKALKTLGMVSFERSQRELKEMTQLTKLGLKDITGENAMAFCATLDKLSDQLHSLKASWSSDVPFKFLEKVYQPPVHLRSLWLSGRLRQLPSWIESLERVSKLALAHTKLREVDMQVIQYSLPSLNELMLFENSYVERAWSIGKGAFPVLKLLHIDGLLRLRDLTLERGSAPQLETLEILQSTESERISVFDNGGVYKHSITVGGAFDNFYYRRQYIRPVRKLENTSCG